jgi:1,4-alpha-glucan branching enzyme
VHRRWHHDKLTFGLLYAFSENFILPISHDEVVHGKGSVVNKMPGDEWQQFANARAYYGFMWGYPGKKLLFMGQEFGQRNEWNVDTSLDWWVLEYAYHRGVQSLVRDLNRLHREKPALHARDCEPEGFQWIVVDDAEHSIFAWVRWGGPGAKPIAIVSNFTPVPRRNYRIGLPYRGCWTEILNTDAPDYGGSGMGNLGSITAFSHPSHGFPASAEITLPPLATVYFEFDSG